MITGIRHRYALPAAAAAAALAIAAATMDPLPARGAAGTPGPAGEPVPAAVAPMLASKNCVSGGPETEDYSVASYVSPRMNGSRLNSLNGAEASCARMIVAAVQARDLPLRAAQIALTTAITESTLHDYTASDDYDSLGLFQQRGSWGTAAQRTDPQYSTDLFLNAMMSKYPNGSWKSGDIGSICQTVQVSAYPDAYDREVYDAKLIGRVLWDSHPSGWATYANSTRRMLRTGGSAGKVYQSTSPLTTTSWTAWSSFGVGSTPFHGTPGIIATHTRDDVFTVDTDGHVWHRIYHSSSGWGGWGHVKTTAGNLVTAMPGTGISATVSQSHQRLFTISPSGKLYQTYYSGGWHSQSLGDAGGGFVGTPAAIGLSDRLDVFATNADGYVYHRIYHTGGSWGSWGRVKTTAGSYVQAKPGSGVAAVYGNGEQRLVTVSPGGHVYQTYYSGGWHSRQIGSATGMTGEPATVFTGNQMDVYASRDNGDVYHDSYRLGGSWSGWAEVAGRP